MKVQVLASKTLEELSTKKHDPASTSSSDVNKMESRANGLFLVCALTCDDTCGVEFEGAGDRSVGRWLDEVGLDGLGLRARPRAGYGLVSTALVVSGFQDWRASRLYDR